MFPRRAFRFFVPARRLFPIGRSGRLTVPVTTADFASLYRNQPTHQFTSCHRSDDNGDFDADDWGDHRALTGRGWSTGFLQGSRDSDEEECKEDGESPSNRRRQKLRRRFYVGQWLDVKDTVNNWLEATVMDMTSSGESESEGESVPETGGEPGGDT